MSLYNISQISGNNPLTILQGFNGYANDFAFTIISFALFMTLLLALYTREQNLSQALLLAGFINTVLTILLFFGQLVPIYIPFVFLSLMVVGVFAITTQGSD